MEIIRKAPEDLVMELELHHKRAHAIASNLEQDFFALRDNLSRTLLFEHYSIEFDILFDYLQAAERKTEELKTRLNMK